LGYLQQPRLT